MIKYISLLRGINVSGQKIIKMEKLREMYSEVGFGNVKSYIQSGNIIFESKEQNSLIVNSKIEEHLFKTLGYQVISILRTAQEMHALVKSDPFGEKVKDENLKFYVVFLKENAGPAEEKALTSLCDERDHYKIIDREVYCSVDKQYQKSPFSNNFIERVLKISGTTRSWRTVNKLVEIIGG